MTSDEKRREVAQELRKQAAYCDGSLSEWWQRLQDTVTSEVDFADPKATFRAIADLIEPQRETCSLHRVKPFSPYATCTSCGAFINTFNGASNATERIDIKYCPCCGAEVVEDG